MIIYFLITILISSAQDVASQTSTSQVSLEGVVVKFDDKVIELRQSSGVVVKIPRSSQPKLKGLILGKDVISVKVSSSDFLRMNRKLFLDGKSPSR